MSKIRQVPSVTVDAIVIRKISDQYEILLIERAREPFKNHLALPGGFVDYNEDPKDAVLRELNEETMLVGKDVRLITVRGHPKRDPRRHVITIVYAVRVENFDKMKGSDDAKDAKFYPLKDVIDGKYKLAFDHHSIIKEFKDWFYKEEGEKWYCL